MKTKGTALFCVSVGTIGFLLIQGETGSEWTWTLSLLCLYVALKGYRYLYDWVKNRKDEM